MTTSIHYLGQSFTDHTVTFSIDGVRWEYYLSPKGCQVVDYLAHKISNGRAFAHAKTKAIKAERLTQ